jgi:ribosomal protein S19E (S16A)
MMHRSDLSQGEQNAMGRISAGSEIDPSMWQDLFRKGFVERRQGRKMLTDKGKTQLSLSRSA